MLNIQNQTQSLVSFVKTAFTKASKFIEDIQPVFHQAAFGKMVKRLSFHGKAIIGLPGAKFHAMTGQVENSHLVRRARAEGRAWRDRVIGRPGYYGAFANFNSLKM
jgi:chitinase